MRLASAEPHSSGLIDETKVAHSVPNLAVQNGPQGQFVYVVTKEQAAEMRPITVERTRGDQTIIASGVVAGETVVTDGQLRLTPGSKVSIKS